MGEEVKSAAVKKRGRPRKGTEAEISLAVVEALASNGLTKEQVALCIGLSADTFTRREKENPEIFAAYARGKARGVSRVANMLFEKALAGDTTSAIFYLKARAGWRDTQAVEVSGRDGGPVEVQDVKAQLAQKLLKMGATDGAEKTSGEPE